jgi:hypothetical protein
VISLSLHSFYFCFIVCIHFCCSRNLKFNKNKLKTQKYDIAYFLCSMWTYHNVAG